MVPTRSSLVVFALAAIGACSGSPGQLDDPLAGRWTLRIVTFAASDGYGPDLLGGSDWTTVTCAGTTSVTFSPREGFVDVALGDHAVPCERRRRIVDRPNHRDTTWVDTTVTYFGGDFQGTLVDRTLVFSRQDAFRSLRFAGTLSEAVVTDGTISGSGSDPGPGGQIWSFFAQGTWTMTR